MNHFIARLSRLPLWKTTALIWQAAGHWTLLWGAVLLLGGLIPVAHLYLTRELVNQISASVGVGFSAEVIQSLALPVGLMAGVLILGALLSSAGEWIRLIQAELLRDHVSERVHRHSLELDLAFYESSEFYDSLNRARSGASERCLSLLENAGGLIRNSVTLFSVTLILLSYGPWLPIILILSAIPVFYIVVYLNRQQHQWWQKTTLERRQLDYFELMMTNGICAAEIRLFNLGDYFKTRYQRLRRQLRRDYFALMRAQSFSRLGASLLTLGVALGAVAWVGRQVLLGLITLGDLALFYQAFNRSQGLVKSSLGNLSQIYRNSLFIENLFEFLSFTPQVADPVHPEPVPVPLKRGIQFEQVAFRYPGAHRPVLTDFNLTLPAGKITAIVGDNGAGKSTLVKLLGRFYDPEAGRITLDGVDLREVSQQDLRQQMTVLFQSPIPYVATPAENIALGDLAIAPTQPSIEAAAQAAGIHTKIRQLAKGYDTLLGKAFPSGTDLSGGEWQRLALARAFFRKAPLIILDEPTSAMDPWAEVDWLQRFRVLAQGRTAVVITHRFTLAMKADIIHVMRDGAIVESGSHGELLDRNGLYAQSWHDQMQIEPVGPSSTMHALARSTAPSRGGQV